MKAIQADLLGFGTVGRGTFEVLRRNQDEIRRRAGRGIRISRIAVRNIDRAREALGAHASTVTLDANPPALVEDPSIEIVIEAVGGMEGVPVYCARWRMVNMW